MEVFVIGATLCGSLGAAFLLQKAMLGAWMHAIDPARRQKL